MTGLPRLVMASANPDKVAEIALVLEGLVDLEPRPPEVPDVVEDGDTLEANARLKAVAICVATGRAAGTIAGRPSGVGGFGYDPVFVPIEGDGRTFAEMGDEKHSISHRGRAFRDLARRLAAGT